jgi:hypothetical protein
MRRPDNAKFSRWRAAHATAASISASVGNRPFACLEYFSTPSTVISKTPPLERTISISAPVSLCSRALAPRARGS